MTRTRRVSRLLTDVADYERQDDSHQEARQADEHEGDPPAPQVVDEAADDQPQKGPDRDAEAIKGDGRRPLRGLDRIGDQRMRRRRAARSEEHTSELQSLMRISYAVFCLKKKNKQTHTADHNVIEKTKLHHRIYTT